MIISIDPGAKTGWAQFSQGWLVACGATKKPYEVPIQGKVVIIEKPQIYRGRLQKGDQNDLITLAMLAGRHQERALRAGAQVELPTPGEWKGQVKKEIHHPRILAALTTEEQWRVSYASGGPAVKPDHNMLDAIGLGLWWLGKEGIRG